MYKWRITILLCGTNQSLRCVYVGPEDNTTDVFNKMFAKTTPNDFIGLAGASPRSNILVRAGEISAIEIRPCHAETEGPDEMP